GSIALDASTGAWTYTLDNSTGSAADKLAQAETATETFTATVTDDNGATATQVVTVTVTGTNDAPILAADPTASHALTEIAGATGGSGVQATTTTLAFTDVDLSDHHTASASAPVVVWSNGTPPAAAVSALTGALVPSVTEAGGAGSVTASFSAPDNAFDFLAKGETLTATYDVTVTDDHGASSVQPVTFLITGTNDAVVVAGGTTASGGVTELAGALGSPAIGHAAGVVAFHDPDLTDRPTATVTAQSANAHGSGGAAFSLTSAQVSAFESAFQITAAASNAADGAINWTYDLADGKLDFLGAGETVTVVSTVLVDDHQGSTVNRDVIVTLTGTDDAPLILADIAGVQKNSSTTVDAAHGVLSNDRDVDTHDSLHVASVNGVAGNVGHSVTGTYGTLTLNADGSYRYVANTSPGALPAKGAAQDVFTYGSDDGHGGTTTGTLTVTVYNNGSSYLQGSASAANGGQVVDAGVGSHTLVGGNGPDVLIAGWGSTVMTGGKGPDTFVVTQADFGAATITDFHPGEDMLQFNHHIFAGYADVMQHATQSGSDVVIAVDPNDKVVLQGVTLSSLHSGDFLFT
ncbi:MAG: repeat-containing protein, partial [Phenylobacterium sp.]|nr:repeat-containing protein [Phenylobacterium sp.]